MYPAFFTAPVPIKILDELIDEAKNGLCGMIGDDRGVPGDCLCILDTENLDSVIHGSRKPMQPFESPFIGMTDDEVRSWMNEHHQHPHFAEFAFAVLDEDTVKNKTCCIEVTDFVLVDSHRIITTDFFGSILLRPSNHRAEYYTPNPGTGSPVFDTSRLIYELLLLDILHIIRDTSSSMTSETAPPALLPATSAVTTGPPKSSFRCVVCSMNFVRRGHLNRHMNRHTKEKSYQCHGYPEVTLISDILLRHQQSHVDDAGKGSERLASFRACTACAARRNRCSGEKPCLTCVRKGLDCTFPARPRRSPGVATAMLAQPSQQIPRQDQDPPELRVILPVDQSSTIPFTEQISQDYLQIRPEVPQWNSAWTEQTRQFQQNQLNQTTLNNPERGFGINESTNQQQPLSMNWMTADNWTYNSPVWPGDWLAIEPSGILPGNIGLESSEALESTLWAPRSSGQGHPPEILLDTQGINEPNSPTYSIRTLSTNATGSVTSSNPPSKYYVDSVGARASTQGIRRKRRSSRVANESNSECVQNHRPSQYNHQTQPQISAGLEKENSLTFEWVTYELYDDLLRNIGIQDSDHSTLDPLRFPSLAQLNDLCQVFFDKFHPRLPLIPKIAFQLVSGMWILVLAVAAVGATFSYTSAPQNPQDMLASYLRAAIEAKVYSTDSDSPSMSTEITQWSSGSEDKMFILQARILSVVMMIHSGSTILLRKALMEFSALVACSRRLKLLRPYKQKPFAFEADGELRQQDDWLEAETRCRAGYTILLLDFIFSYEFDQAPLLELVDAQDCLPCSEHIWEIISSGRADKDSKDEEERVTLVDALKLLYTKKRLVPNLSEFGRILLVQGVCRQIIEVFRYSRNPMAEWMPTAQTQPLVELEKTESWPPSSSRMAKWRNSACDCLDVLHWSANSRVAQSEGFEDPSILHLHLARLLILTPVVPIREVADSYALKSTSSVSINGFNPQADQSSYYIHQWAIRDQYKARLSLVHAGAIFWHLRRYNCDSFIEPFTAYLATLAIWSFSLATQYSRLKDNSSVSGPVTLLEASSSDESDPEITFINLDRPCDDESVQAYVRAGHKVAGNMARVGDICSDGAPLRILQEGLRLLRGENIKNTTEGSQAGNASCESKYAGVWGIAESYIISLERLVNVTIRATTAYPQT
ncbi:hypothetical protein V493_02326 [Pseudogymnoascus sp. VKM F-4281 (FW-2241)]|nr:hypothetical protein V493_02326 [Pseudogymnoascus sp. VKM F-4281 (FW-2241)]